MASCEKGPDSCATIVWNHGSGLETVKVGPDNFDPKEDLQAAGFRVFQLVVFVFENSLGSTAFRRMKFLQD